MHHGWHSGHQRGRHFGFSAESRLIKPPFRPFLLSVITHSEMFFNYSASDAAANISLSEIYQHQHICRPISNKTRLYIIRFQIPQILILVGRWVDRAEGKVCHGVFNGCILSVFISLNKNKKSWLKKKLNQYWYRLKKSTSQASFNTAKHNYLFVVRQLNKNKVVIWSQLINTTYWPGKRLHCCVVQLIKLLFCDCKFTSCELWSQGKLKATEKVLLKEILWHFGSVQKNLPTTFRFLYRLISEL